MAFHREGGIVTSGLSRLSFSSALILRVRRSGRGPRFSSENLRIFAQWLDPKLRDLICLVWEGSTDMTLAGSQEEEVISSGDPFARFTRVFT